MKICIRNGHVITMDLNREKIDYNTDILIDNGKIIEIGKNIEVDSSTKCIDADGKVVMPGLINTHAHVPMSIFRETLDGYTLQDWLNQKIWPMEDKLTGEDIYYASYLSFIEMIKTGTTTINDMYFMTDDIIKAMKETGIRLQTTRTLMNISGDEDGKVRIRELEELLDRYTDDDRLTFNVGIHGMYTSTNPYIDECINFAKEKGLRVNIHFCENSSEVEDIRRIHGKEPVDVLQEKFEGVDTVLAHAVKHENEDLDKIKDMSINVAHCPISNLRLGCGVAKIKRMQELGINVALGTDGQGSGSRLDLFETMKFTALLQKGINENPKDLPAYEVLKMATINGAKALGLEDKVGSIEKGKCADIIIINLEDVKLKPINDLISEVVYNVTGDNVVTTIVDGSILMENRCLTVSNEEEIYTKCEEIIERIKI